jgi:hypothetical protein
MPLLVAFLVIAADPDIVVAAPRHALAAPIVPDAELARMRGGLRLPNGLDISLGIDIQTRVNGLLALHTVYASDGVAPGIRVYADGEKTVPLAPTTLTVSSSGTAGAPTLIVDRSPTGTTVIPSSATPATTVNLVSGDPSIWLSGAGQIRIPVTPNGPAVAAPAGDVRLTQSDAGTVVSLETPTLLVQQLVGQATGVVVANSADNQVIDTVSSVNVDVQGLSPQLFAGAFAMQRLALDAATAR